MTTYARIVGGQVIDVTMVDPATLYHADVASQFVTVPSGTGNGDSYDSKTGTWTKYTPRHPSKRRPCTSP